MLVSFVQKIPGFLDEVLIYQPTGDLDVKYTK